MSKTYLLTGVDEKKWNEFQACCREGGTTAKAALLQYIYYAADVYKHRHTLKDFAEELMSKGGKKK